MDSQLLLLALSYSYPVALCVGLLASRAFFHKRQHGVDFPVPIVRRRGYARTAIWYLQVALCAVLLASILTKLSGLGWIVDLDDAERSAGHVQLASYIAVCLYFAAGLLPDPDQPFQPQPSNFHTWAIALIFEASLLTISIRSPWASPEASASAILTGIRMLLLLLMCLSFAVAERSYDAKATECERQSLASCMRGSYSTLEAGPPAGKNLDAQSTGWLDYFFGFSVLFPYIWPSDSRQQQMTTVFCLLLLVAQRIINVLVPYQLGILVDALGRGSMPYREIFLYVLYSGLQGQQGVVGAFRAMLWIPISQSLYRRLTCAAFEHVLDLSLDFHLSKRLGEVMAALSKGSALNTFLDGFAFQLFPMVFDLGVAAGYFFIRFNYFYSLIVLAVMWTYIFMTIYMAKYRGRARREMAKRDREKEAAKSDAIMAYETVHYNSAPEHEATQFEGLVRSFQKAEFAVLFSLNGLNILQNLMFTFGILLMSLLSSYQISTGGHKVSMFVSLLAYFTQLQAPLAFFGSFYNQVQNNLVDAERMLDLFKHMPDVRDNLGASPLHECRGRIAFRNVSFAYNERRPALRNISFTVEAGTSTAIVGESGSGKSTCLKLLFRFYNVDSGAITVDGSDVRDITIQSLRRHIGIVPQDTVLFNASLMYNLKYAKPDATAEEIYAACRAASIHDKILSLPEGYETSVGERGLKISGGEKQRIAIARAILKRPRLVLLDEATASLDSRTEKEIHSALESVTRGLTTITIAHRLSTITNADQILVLHDGEIVERGRHEDLLRSKGRYHAMWERQTKIESKEAARSESKGNS